ncbi:MAG TPA: DNA methyltransferase [Symbiobacteriaceae bacterium]|nr:DNA methyltransferase [Symbiobacteriaceae bacterium]
MAAPSKPPETLAPHHVDMGERGIYHTGNRLNDLTGKEWVFSTRSVINKAYPPSFQFELRSRHGGQKPPELCADLIRTFTKAGQRVLDPFAGVGGTLLGATLAGRRATGIELNPAWVDIYQEVCRRENLNPQAILTGDCRTLLPDLEPGAFDLLLTDVPYWDMDRRRRSTGKFKRAGGAASERRQSKLNRFDPDAPPAPTTGLSGLEDWLSMLGDVFTHARRLLKPRAYLAVFIGDMYHSGRYHPLSAYLMGLLDNLGYTMKANLIWYDVSKKLNVYGYRYEFIPSMTHQNILVFRAK